MELPNPALFLFYCCFCFLLSHHVSSAASVYIVHMDKSLMPVPFSTHHHWYSSILTSLNSVQDQTTLDYHNPIYVYDNAFHGFCALLSQHQLEALKASPAFISAYSQTYLKPHTTRSVDFLSLGSASGLWPAAHYGEDVIIGVIDTGVWPESPSFRDHGMGKIPARWKGICQEGEQFNSSMCNRKLIGARYFNQGIKAVDPNITIPMNSARDIFGHGTHVASIAAGNFVHDVSYFGYANGTARGVAPRARLAVYKVMWSATTLGAADVLAGIDQAVADGVDILSISLGTGDASVNLYDNPLSIASFGARQKGIVVTFAGGNDGPNTRTIMEQGIPWSIVVAAGTIDRWFAGTLTLGNGKSITGWSLFPGNASIRNLPIVYNETFAACDSNLPEMTHDVIVVCNLSLTTNASFDIIMNNLPRSKARAAIIIGDLPSLYRSYASFSYPVAIVNSTEGRQVIAYVSNNGAPEATIFFHQTIMGPGPGPRPAPAVGDISSRGPARSYDGILKPDLLAPGMLILAAFPPFPLAAPTVGNTSLYSNYTLLFGTSMACPHISGVSALLKAAHPNWSPSAIQSAMMTTANPLNNAKQPIVDLAYGTPASPLAIGSGQVDPNRALDPGLVYDNTPQDFVNHVCSLNFTREQTRTLIGSRNNCSTSSPDLNYPSFVATFQPMDKGLMLRRRFQRTVTNVGNSAATYRVRVEAPLNATIIIRPRQLVFRNKYEKLRYSLSVRFMGDPEIQHRHGTITWIDHTGKYSVRSPIMVSAGAGFFV